MTGSVFLFDDDLVFSALFPLRQIWSVAVFLWTTPNSLFDFFHPPCLPSTSVSAELSCAGWGERCCYWWWAKEEWRESEFKARRGRVREIVWFTRMKLQPGQHFCVCKSGVRSSLQHWLQPVCVCVCAVERELQEGLDYCSNCWVSICELSPFPLHCYRSIIINAWPFGSMLFELSFSRGSTSFCSRSLLLSA